MGPAENRDIYRLRYRQGQLLRARDFRDERTGNAQMRWWHNRALHLAVGIASGLHARLTDAGVQVSAGLAYDCYGRELLLPCAMTVPLPETIEPPGLIGIIVYTPPVECCAPAPSPCLPAKKCFTPPGFVWRAAADLDAAEGVAVTRLSAVTLDTPAVPLTFPPSLTGVVAYEAERKLLLAAGALTGRARDDLFAVSTDASYQAAAKTLAGLARSEVTTPVRPLARPRIGTGTTIPGSGWELWTTRSEPLSPFEVFGNGQLIGFQIQVDASAAGFTKTPCYFASLESMATPYELIEGASNDGFTFRLLYPGLAGRVLEPALEGQLLALIQAFKLSVCWIGIQAEPGMLSLEEDEVCNGCS